MKILYTDLLYNSSPQLAVDLPWKSQVSLEVGKVYIPEPRSFPDHVARDTSQNGGQDHVAGDTSQNGGQDHVAGDTSHNGGQDHMAGDTSQNGGRDHVVWDTKQIGTQKTEESEEKDHATEPKNFGAYNTNEKERGEKEEKEAERREKEGERREKEEERRDCGAPCKYCLFLVSGHTKIILAFQDKATLMVSIKTYHLNWKYN